MSQNEGGLITLPPGAFILPCDDAMNQRDAVLGAVGQRYVVETTLDTAERELDQVHRAIAVAAEHERAINARVAAALEQEKIINARAAAAAAVATPDLDDATPAAINAAIQKYRTTLAEKARIDAQLRNDKKAYMEALKAAFVAAADPDDYEDLGKRGAKRVSTEAPKSTEGVSKKSRGAA